MSHVGRPTAAIPFVLLRCRLGVRLPSTCDQADFEERLCAEIIAAVDDLGGVVELLQLAVAVHPAWRAAGPIDRSSEADRF
jgi:hypothetical protein